MIETPLYLYGSYEIPSTDDGALFHYTKFESFLKIIESMTLRSSPLYKMNDLNEANINSLDWNKDFLLMIEAEKYVKERCSVISFSKNYMAGTICQEGSNHPAMWAHYAEDSNGVCIVLDKDSLLEKNNELLAQRFHCLEPVNYCLHCAPKDEIAEESYSGVSDFVRRNYKELFYKKHIDWKYEDEVRFFVESPEIYLDIKGAIKYIVLGGRLKNEARHLSQLIEQMITPGTKSFRYFSLHSFAQMMTTVDGYLTVNAAPTILIQLKKMVKESSLAKAFLDWQDASYLEE